MKKETKIIFIVLGSFIGIILFVAIIGFFGYKVFQNKKVEIEHSDSYNENNLNQNKFIDIDIDEYLDILKDNKAHIVYIARPSCSYCQLETPILTDIVRNNNLKVYYLNTEGFYDATIMDYTEDGYKLINSLDVFSEGISTPNTLIVKNNKVIDGVYGYVSKSELEDLFERNKFM